MKFLLGIFLVIAVGLSLGLIGAGGSILAVPILKYIIGVTTKEAIAMSLFVVGCVSIIGLIPHWQNKNINLKIALIFIPPAMLGAFVGAKITSLPIINDTIQLLAFGIIMVVASILMITKSRNSLSPQNENKKSLFKELSLIIVEGLGVGILTGFVGVGGGFLIIPALVLVGKIPMKQAVGTSLLIISFNSFSGFLGYVNQIKLDWNLIISLTLAASVGIVIGSYLSKFISAESLQKAFGYFVLVVAIFVLIVR